MRSCGARILDISYTGVSLVSEAPLNGGQVIYVRLEGPETTEWVECVLRGVSPREDRTYLVRLAFRETCPYDFFKAAVYGKPT
jgi:hypothetical protein